MGRPGITVLIHTLDEIEQVEECLRSVEWADEIYLIDSYSSDGTADFVRERFPNVRVELHESKGSAAQKNYGIGRVRNEWVLVVDADERVTPELRDEILATLERAPSAWAYSIGRRNIVLDEEMRFGLLGRDRVIRLFHRDHARYPNLRVHADLVVDGNVGQLQQRLVHYYVQSFDHLAEKMDRYGFWGAAQLFLDRRRSTILHLLFNPFWRFAREYVGLGGFLDGRRGFIVARMHAYYTFLKYVRLWEFNRLARRGLPVPLPEFEEDPSIWELPWLAAREESTIARSRRTSA